MDHFPIFLSVSGRRILVVGDGEVALAKLRILAKTTADLHLFAPTPAPELAGFIQGIGHLHRRTFTPSDLSGAALVYAAQGDAAADASIARMARSAGVLVNIVDNLEGSDFITPAIVDRDPVTVAIGTEGASPVLARAIKADLEARLPKGLGALARAGKAFRPIAEALPQGPRRRAFWADYYFQTGPEVLEAVGAELLPHALRDTLNRHLAAAPKPGRVDWVGAGPGDPELLTLRARRLLDTADLVIHDRDITAPILDLARREATAIIADGDHSALMIEQAAQGAHVLRLVAGSVSPGAELQAVTRAGIAWGVTPGVPTAHFPPFLVAERA